MPFRARLFTSQLRRSLPAGLLALLLGPASVAAQNACEIERLGSHDSSSENEYGWLIARDGERLLVTAAEEVAYSPLTGASWFDDGRGHILRRSASGGWEPAAILNWSANLPFNDELGRYGDLSGDQVVLAAALNAQLHPFRLIQGQWKPEAAVTVAAQAGGSVRPGPLCLRGDLMAVSVRESLFQGPALTRVDLMRRQGSTWTVEASFPIDTGGASAPALQFLSDGRLAVGAPGDDAAAPDAGAVRFFEQGPSGWIASGLLLPSNPSAGLRFGSNLSSSGQTLAVFSQGVSPSQRSVEIWTWSTVAWTLEATLPIQNPAAAGPSVLELDGDRLAWGTPGEQISGFSGAAHGAVRLYQRELGQWLFKQTITAAAPESRDWFGQALAFDGETLLVGAPQDGESNTDRGYVARISLAGQGCANFLMHPSVHRLHKGARFDFALIGPPSLANSQYLVLLSATPPGAGFQLDGVQVPLSIDGLTLLQPAPAAGFLVPQQVGNLTAAGSSAAPGLEIFGGPSSALAGKRIYATWLAFQLSPVPLGTLFAGNSQSVLLVP
jgi:hypothetical protein